VKRAIKTHLKDFLAIIALVIMSVLVAGYILTNERLALPFLSPSQYTINADFTEAKAVTPGQGQTVNISGVKVGEISGVSVKNGTAVVQMSIDQKYRHLIHQDATALLRPRTGLEDMFVELTPSVGTNDRTPIAKSGYTIPLSNTLPNIESDEVLSALNSDTRAYLDLLVNGAGQGLKNKGTQLAQVLERFEPTHRDLARLNQALSVRGHDIQQLIHSLAVLNKALAAKKVQIISLINASATVFRAFASEGSQISRAVADLPGTLEQTTATLQKVRVFANALGPLSVNFLPAARALPGANQATIHLAGPNAPSCGSGSTCQIIRDQIRPFVVAAQPLVRNLKPVSINLADATPYLASSFSVLNHLFNMLGYSPGGGQHGYLWWLAWLDHNARTLFSQQDANGVFRPLFLQFSCQQLGMITSSPSTSPLNALGLISTALNLAPSQYACRAAGFGVSGGSGGLGLPPLPLGLSKDTSKSASAASAAKSNGGSTGTAAGATKSATSAAKSLGSSASSAAAGATSAAQSSTTALGG
jgi:phospholipid/cholesterol/gamma-HCH transport system substrate-binding protein